MQFLRIFIMIIRTFDWYNNVYMCSFRWEKSALPITGSRSLLNSKFTLGNSRELPQGSPPVRGNDQIFRWKAYDGPLSTLTQELNLKTMHAKVYSLVNKNSRVLRKYLGKNWRSPYSRVHVSRLTVLATSARVYSKVTVFTVFCQQAMKFPAMYFGGILVFWKTLDGAIFVWQKLISYCEASLSLNDADHPSVCKDNWLQIKLLNEPYAFKA